MREGQEQSWGIGKEFHQIYLIWARVKIHQNRLTQAGVVSAKGLSLASH